MKKNHLKRIGILMAQYASDAYGNLYGQSQSYLKFFQQYGTVFLIAPDMVPEDLKLDLLVLPGGPDVSLALQNNVTEFPYATGKDQPTFTYFFKNNLQKWIDAGVPVFGICLGMQYLNVHFGGSLTHDGSGHQLRDTHWILGFSDAALKMDAVMDRVNSRHHQFVRQNQLSSQLVALAYSFQDDELIAPTKEKKVAERKRELLEAYLSHKWEDYEPSCVEAFRHKTLKIAGVQWHPEDLLVGNFETGDYISHTIINWLLSKPAVNSDMPIVYDELNA